MRRRAAGIIAQLKQVVGIVMVPGIERTLGPRRALEQGQQRDLILLVALAELEAVDDVFIDVGEDPVQEPEDLPLLVLREALACSGRSTRCLICPKAP